MHARVGSAPHLVPILGVQEADGARERAGGLAPRAHEQPQKERGHAERPEDGQAGGEGGKRRVGARVALDGQVGVEEGTHLHSVAICADQRRSVPIRADPLGFR